jgi:hypothetical protein
VFGAWADPDTAAMLPPSLAHAVGRERAEPIDVARKAVRPWALARDEWRANPMALMVQLARSVKGQK